MSNFLEERLGKIRAAGNYRSLTGDVQGIDFWSNDYLGLVEARTQVQGKVVGRGGRDSDLTRLPTGDSVPENLVEKGLFMPSGATGSRSISGDSAAWHSIEAMIADYHGHGSALVFNSGYTANLGLLSAILTRTDTIIYDEFAHASCRDGIRLGQAKALRFRHNDLEDLRTQIDKARPDGQTFVLTEGRFSMDGDLAPLAAISTICQQANAHLIVDEAHSVGIEGKNGAGLVAELGLEDKVFATIVTYGKAFGSHGAAVLGSLALRHYLINTCRPFIYTTGPAPAQWAGIQQAYQTMASVHASRLSLLRQRIQQFSEGMKAAGLGDRLDETSGPIQILHLPGNDAVMLAEAACREQGLLVKGIRSPTVPAGQERLRICLHSFNTEAEVDQLVNALIP
jgi:8-amino-7-oxononanoate synthase